MNPKTERPRLLILYAANSVHTSTIADYLEAFRVYSEFEVFFSDAVQKARVGMPLEHFDAVLVHYSVRLCYPDYIAPDFVDALEKFRGPKVLTIQDEYENTEQARKWIQRLRFDTVLSVVPAEYIKSVYPPERFPGTVFKSILTGYVPSWLANEGRPTPIATRPYNIVYRGRRLHYFYGRLGREKEIIGNDVKRLAASASLKVDIESDDERRIYGDRWFEFLRSGKTTLGTESGANIFDIDGSIRKSIDDFLGLNPAATFEDVEKRFLGGLEGKYALMNQISPKMLEAIACGTVLVMFEGLYSGILKADRHFIALKKDFSNWPSVLEKIRNDGFLEKMADVAYTEIIGSKKWSYETFVAEFDQDLLRLISSKANSQSRPDRVFAFVAIDENKRYMPNCFNKPVDHLFIHQMNRHEFTGKFLDNLVAGFELSRPGEWFRLVWVKAVPESLRRMLSRSLKNRIRRMVGIRNHV